MKKNNHVLLKTLSLNFLNICIHYPKMIIMAKHTKKYTTKQLYDYAIKICKLIINTSKIKIESYGLENIPSYDGLYLCANHQEKFDSLAIWYTFPREVGVILSDKAIHRPFIREFCKLIKSQRLINSNIHSVIELYNNVKEDLINKKNYMIFPEGHYTDDAFTVENLHAGSFKSPLKAKATIIPVALIDSYRIYNKGFKTTNPIQVHYLKPIFYDEYKDLSTQEIANIVQNRITETINTFQHH